MSNHQNETVSEEKFAKKLSEEMKIFCWFFTYPNHKIKTIHIKNTSAKKCKKKLVFMRSEDKELGSIQIPVAAMEQNSTRYERRKALQKVFLVV
jgi:hypothetical protein